MNKLWLFCAGLALIGFTGCDELDPTTGPDVQVSDNGSGDASDASKDAPATPGLTVVGPGAKEIPNGGDLDDTTMNGIPPWSSGVTSLTINNYRDTAVTITSLSLEMLGETDPREWTFNEWGTVSKKPMDFAGTVIESKMGVAIGFHFRPFTSGPRHVKANFVFDDGTTFTTTIIGRGRDNATLSPKVHSDGYERLFARSNVEKSHSMQPGALAADDAGNLYMNANVSSYSDKFTNNMMFAQVKADGSLGWVKEWDEPFAQSQRDIGDNGEIGPADESISVDADGQLYLVAQRSLNNSNSIFQAMVTRVDAASGNVVWSTGLANGPDEDPKTAANGLRGQVIDATLADRVLVMGQAADSAGFFVAALAKADGSILWVRRVLFGGTHAAGAVKIHGSDLYFGGRAANSGFLAKITGVDSDTPELAWSQQFAGFTIVKGLDYDGTNMVAAIEVRGAATFFAAVGVNPATGELTWKKVWDPNNSTDTNNTLGIMLRGDKALVHGRIAITPFDTQGGDGFVLSLDAATGGYDWASFYYNGKGAQTFTWHHITGIAQTPSGDIFTISQGTPGANNKDHFWGRWYQANNYGLDFPAGDGSERLVDFEYPNDAVTGTTQYEDMPNVTGYSIDTTDVWKDYGDMVLEDPQVLQTQSFQTGVHVLLQKLEIQ